MIGDQLTYYSTYQHISHFIIETLAENIKHKKRFCISIGGESGCGKTSLAFALLKDFESILEIKGYLFQMDDYFFLPPGYNHQKRLNNIADVGTQEVNLDLLDEHLNKFKNGKKTLKKPLVHYKNNKIQIEKIDSSQYHFCIVEGTYVSILHQPDYKIFIETTYHDTKKARWDRNRDELTNFNENVLQIEHDIIKAHKTLATIHIDKNLKINQPKP